MSSVIRRTISIPKDLNMRMEGFPEENWSKVAAGAFEARLEDGGNSEWRFNPENLCLEFYEKERWMYEIDLERCNTSAELLDWVFQIAPKSWATAKAVSAMLAALDDLLEPQETLCSGGKERGPLNVKKHLARVSERVWKA